MRTTRWLNNDLVFKLEEKFVRFFYSRNGGGFFFVFLAGLIANGSPSDIS